MRHRTHPSSPDDPVPRDRPASSRTVPPLRQALVQRSGGSLAVNVLAAARDVGSAPFRAVFVRVIGLTVCGLILFGIGVGKLIGGWVVLPHLVWLATTIHALTYLLVFVALAFCVAPISFAVASCFFDRLAASVELRLSDGTHAGRPLPLAQATWIGCQFALLSLLVNGAALLASFLPGLNAIVFFVANAYLLGRGFFEMAALRHVPRSQLRAIRRRHAGRIFLAGCCCAALASVPVLNALTPLFATALLVRVTWSILAKAQTLSAV